MKKKLIAVAMTGALCAGSVLPALAATGGGTITTESGTDIYAGITLDDPDAKIKVEVPTLFAFVVNGTVATDNTAVKSAITLDAENDTTTSASILLPNVKVKVTTPSTSTAAPHNGKYSLQVVGDGNMKFTNYSTKYSDGADSVDNREGLSVSIIGSIKNEGTDQSRNYWRHVNNADLLGADTNGFKRYTLEIDEIKFSTANLDGSFEMGQPLVLAAPSLANNNLDTTTNFAIAGEIHEATFNVYVGGTRGQYNQVEESAKVGTIVWTVQAEEQTGAPTAPDRPFLPEQPPVQP